MFKFCSESLAISITTNTVSHTGTLSEVNCTQTNGSFVFLFIQHSNDQQLVSLSLSLSLYVSISLSYPVIFYIDTYKHLLYTLFAIALLLYFVVGYFSCFISLRSEFKLCLCHARALPLSLSLSLSGAFCFSSFSFLKNTLCVCGCERVSQCTTALLLLRHHRAPPLLLRARWWGALGEQ